MNTIVKVARLLIQLIETKHVCQFYLLIFPILILASSNSFAVEHPLILPLSESFFSKKDSTEWKEKGNIYFTIGPLFLLESYKDFTVSSNTYRSLSPWPGIRFGLEKKYRKYSGYLNLLAVSQNLNDDEGLLFGDENTKLLSFRLNTSRTYRIKNLCNNKITWKLGYSLNAEYTQRLNDKFVNAAYTFDIWANAGIANRFEYPFTIKTERNFLFIHPDQPLQHFSVSWQVNVPLAGAITRPNYAGIRHFANGAFLSNLFREIANNTEFTSLHNFIMVQSQVELLAPLGNHNKLRIAYDWQGFRYNNTLAKLQGSWGGIEIGLIFKLDSREVVQQ